MDHSANKVCGGCCAISLNMVDTESSVSPIKTQLPNGQETFCFTYPEKAERLNEYFVSIS